MGASTGPTLLTVSILVLAVSSGFIPRSAADNGPECPYPCLPPPGSAANLPPPPPSVPWLPYLPPPPPPPQAYTPGWLPPPSGYQPEYRPPGLTYPAPPPPDRIMPYFPYYFRTGKNAAPLHKDGGSLWTAVAALSSSMLVLHFFIY